MKELKIFDNPQNVKRLLLIFWISLLVLLIIDLFVPKETEFPWEGFPNFFATYGFLSCVVLVFVAKLLRLFVKRDEDYYE